MVVLLVPMTATRVLTIVAAVGAGVAGGVFFAFSTFVMPALGRIPDPAGVRAMQAINEAAPGPWLMTLLFGTAGCAIATAVLALRQGSGTTTTLCVVGCGLYLLAIVLTAAYHVPHNDALGRLDPDSAAAARSWSTYLTQWTRWNHVRTLTCIAAASCLTVAARTV